MYCACCICSCCLFNRMCQIIKLERNDWFLSGLGCLLFCGALLFLASAVCMLLPEWHLNNLQGLLPQLVCWQGPAELLPVRLQEDESLMACKDGFNSQAAKMLSLFVSFRFPHTMDGRPKQLARYSETVSCSNGFWGYGPWRGLRAWCTSRPIFASDLAPQIKPWPSCKWDKCGYLHFSVAYWRLSFIHHVSVVLTCRTKPWSPAHLYFVGIRGKQREPRHWKGRESLAPRRSRRKHIIM